MSATLPPYRAILNEDPPPYIADESNDEQEQSRPHIQAAGDHRQYVPGPALLNQENPMDPFTTSSAIPQFTRNHYILTIIMMTVCGVLLNVLAFSCLIPALIFSKKSIRARESGDYTEARRRAQWSLWLNIAALISYLILMMLAIGIVIVVVFTT